LDRLPLLAPAGAIVAMTDNGDDYSRLHDEPSRGLRVFPGADEGASSAALLEDDGISLVGASTRVTIALSWTANRVRVEVGASGNYPLPYSEMRVILPEDETRTVELSGAQGIGLRL
jgi:alpha-glucosidase